MENNQIKQQLPNAVAVLVLGICSILFGCFFIGLICGIIGLVMSKSGIKLYQENPNAYDNYGMLNTGRILSIIGVVLGTLYVVYYVICINILGAATNGLLNEVLENLF